MSQSKAQASFRKNLHNGCEQMDLAWTYYEDGALESMARCLEEAAKLFRRAAEQKNFMLLRNGAKRVNIPLDKLMIDPKVIKPKKADPPKPPIRCCMATFQTMADWKAHASPSCRPQSAGRKKKDA